MNLFWNALAAMAGVHSARQVLMPCERGAHGKWDCRCEGTGTMVPSAEILPVGIPVAVGGGKDHWDRRGSRVATLPGKVQMAMSCQDSTLWFLIAIPAEGWATGPG